MSVRAGEKPLGDAETSEFWRHAHVEDVRATRICDGVDRVERVGLGVVVVVGGRRARADEVFSGKRRAEMDVERPGDDEEIRVVLGVGARAHDAPSTQRGDVDGILARGRVRRDDVGVEGRPVGVGARRRGERAHAAHAHALKHRLARGFARDSVFPPP